MVTTLSGEEQELLKQLLIRIADDDNAFLPDLAFRAFHKIVPWPAVEVLIHDDDGRFVLTYRNDDFTGWHIPGGFMRINETFQAACDRHVRKEKVADAVSDLRLIASHTWLKGEHPYGHNISLVIACKAVGKVAESEVVRWYSDIPSGIIKEQHPQFLSYFQGWIKGARGAATIL
jgi:ADP-ribose pyrophosphatase YjhB (NUDIX family)